MVAETPQSISLDLGRTNLTINQRCRNCKHLDRIPHPAYKSVCRELGMQESSRPCERFSVDPTKLKGSSRAFRHLYEFIKENGPNALSLAASLLMEESRSRKYGFSLGQTVYFNAFGPEYRSNYFRAKVVSATKLYVNIIADDGFTAMLYHKNVLSPEQWVKKERWLENNERLVDPKYRLYTQSATTAEINSRKIKDKLAIPEFDSTSKHQFSVTSGRMGGRKVSKYSDPSSHKSLLSLIKVR